MAGVLQVEVRDFLIAQGGSGFLRPELARRGETAFQMDLPRRGVRIISPHPLRPDLFLGKIIVSPRRRIPGRYLPRTQAVFFETLLGRLRIAICGVSYEIEEGDSLIFQGDEPYSLENPSYRDATARLLTVPSFLKAQEGGKEGNREEFLRFISH